MRCASCRVGCSGRRPAAGRAALLPKLDRLASIAADGVRMQAGLLYFLRFEHFKGNCLRSGQQHDAAAVAAAPAAARHYLQGALCYHQMQMQMQHYIHAASAWRRVSGSSSTSSGDVGGGRRDRPLCYGPGGTSSSTSGVGCRSTGAGTRAGDQ